MSKKAHFLFVGIAADEDDAAWDAIWHGWCTAVTAELQLLCGAEAGLVWKLGDEAVELMQPLHEELENKYGLGNLWHVPSPCGQQNMTWLRLKYTTIVELELDYEAVWMCGNRAYFISRLGSDAEHYAEAEKTVEIMLRAVSYYAPVLVPEVQKLAAKLSRLKGCNNPEQVTAWLSEWLLVRSCAVWAVIMDANERRSGGIEWLAEEVAEILTPQGGGK